MNIVLEVLYIGDSDIWVPSGGGQKLHDPYRAGGTLHAVVQGRLLVALGGERKPVDAEDPCRHGDRKEGGKEGRKTDGEIAEILARRTGESSPQC